MIAVALSVFLRRHRPAFLAPKLTMDEEPDDPGFFDMVRRCTTPAFLLFVRTCDTGRREKQSQLTCRLVLLTIFAIQGSECPLGKRCRQYDCELDHPRVGRTPQMRGREGGGGAAVAEQQQQQWRRRWRHCVIPGLQSQVYGGLRVCRLGLPSVASATGASASCASASTRSPASCASRRTAARTTAVVGKGSLE